MAVITHNMSAMNTHRSLNASSKNKKTSAEKLSSGYKINRSADDAAGLTISEKMRYQIRGLNKASTNIQDGVSLIQTADGALTEMHDILQRMNEISTQAANDTNTDTDRSAIQTELDELKKEINRISATTQFNTLNILSTYSEPLVTIDTDDYAEVTMNDMFYGIGNRLPTMPVFGKTLDFSNITNENKEKLIGKSFYVTCSEYCDQLFTFTFSNKQTSSIDIDDEDLLVEIGLNDAALNNGSDIAGKIFSLIQNKQADFEAAVQNKRPGWTNTFNDTVIGHANGVSAANGQLTFYSLKNVPPYFPGMGLIRATDLLETEKEYFLQTSDRPFQSIALNLRTINSSTLGINTMDVSSYEKAGETMDSVQNAVSTLSDYRSYLGAMQNRLEKAMSVVDNTSENTQHAESRLRDTDMAEEMVLFSKEKIIEQFGQMMLSQANQSTQNVLSLLS